MSCVANAVGNTRATIFSGCNSKMTLSGSGVHVIWPHLVSLSVEVIFPVQDVFLETVWQRQEAHEDGCSETQAAKTLSDFQPAQVL